MTKQTPAIKDDGMVAEQQNYTRTDETKEDAETSSSSSCTGKSSSRGGYSADCSASDDQSSDFAGGGSKPTLGLSSLNLNDTAAEEASSPSMDSSSGDDGENGTKEGKPYATSRKEMTSSLKTTTRKHHHSKSSSSKKKAEKDANHQHSRSIHPMPAVDAMADTLFNDDKAAPASQTDFMLNDQLPLPQWNGFVIRDFMDPRIDLSTVGTTVADVPAALRPLALDQSQAAPRPDTSKENQEPSEAPEMPSLESYMHLMEAVRPFFQAQGVSLALAHQQALQQADLREKQEEERRKNDSAQSEAVSSEGFTSFFTTTDSNANGTSGSGSPGTSDMEKKRKATGSNAITSKKERDETMDDSSMAVLARAKRKYRNQSEESSNSTSSTSSREKRVRIQEGHHQQSNRAAGAIDQRDDNVADAGDQADNNAAPAVRSVPVVTDVSSSARTSGASGSGSGGNTGSGSNQGSSGSGNDGKGSGEELTKEDGSGDGANDGSDRSNGKKLGIGLGGGPAHCHPSATGQEPAHRSSTGTANQEQLNVDSNEAAREQKLLDKKRKRIEMRREYEAQQQFESSESSDTTDDQYFRPGRPVTLDQVLVFSKIPRIVVQGAPPFLVVHTNAAYSRLTGVDSHVVVGKPISVLLSMQESATVDEPIGAAAQSNEEIGLGDRLPNDLAAAEATGRARAEASVSHDRKEMSLERLIATCGFGRIGIVHVNAKPHQIVGRNVTVMEVNGIAAGQGPARRDEDSNGTSLTSSCKEEPYQLLPCRISIAPVVSSDNSLSIGAPIHKESEPHHIEKRAKHHHGTEQSTPVNSETHKKYSPLQLVSHFVIQLQPQSEGLDKNGSLESLSLNSTSVEAQLLGLSKDGLRNQQEVVAPLQGSAASEGSTSVRSDSKELIAAIG